MNHNTDNLQAVENTSKRHLKRVLSLWDLVFYGIVLNQPVAAVGLFGLVSVISKGHMVTTLLVSMLAMTFTAISYGRMAAIFPSSGSAYTYVGKGINSHLGFLAGWTMTLCYLIIPMINVVFGVLSFQRLIPGLLYIPVVIVFVAVITFLNLMGVRSGITANKIMLYIMLVIIFAFIILAIRYILQTLGWHGLADTTPVYNSKTFSFAALSAGTSLVALTYVGFDGITTLSEEAINPKRDILLAIIIICLFTGIFGGIQMYLAQQTAQTMWLDSDLSENTQFFNRIPENQLETSFMTVCAQVGGNLLHNSMTITMIIACLGSGLAGQSGAARLLYGMGKDNVLPRKFFGYISKKHNSPIYNIILIGILTIIGAIVLNYQKVAGLINFAALVALMGVNLAAINQFYYKSPSGQRNLLTDFIVPASGFLFCSWIWVSLPNSPKILGGIWLLIGIIYLSISTKGFRKQPATINFNDV